MISKTILYYAGIINVKLYLGLSQIAGIINVRLYLAFLTGSYFTNFALLSNI